MLEKTISAPTNPDKFIKNLRTIFVNLSFEIKSSDANGFVMLNPQRMQSNRQNPLMGVSEISVSLAENNINIAADTSNVQRLKRFLMFFPSLLTIALGILFHILGLAGAMPKSDITWALPLGLGMGFLIIFMPIGTMIEKSTITALDSAIRNAIVLSEESE